jgi:O-antigen/teichoic acid export membrane protein
MGNLGVLLSGRALNAPLSLLHISLAIRLLGGYGFGLISMIYAFARTMGDVLDFQSWQTVLHYGLKPLTAGRLRSFHRIVGFSLLLDGVSGTLGCAIAILLSITIPDRLGWPPELSTIGPLYCISILFMTAATPTGILRTLNRYDLLSFQGITSTLTKVCGMILLWFTHGTLVEVAALWFIADGVAWFLLLALAWRELRRQNLTKGFWRNAFSAVPDTITGVLPKEFPGIWRFAFSTNTNSTLALAFGHVGTLMVGALLGPAEAGYYRIASQVAAGIAKPATLIQTTLYPELARMWRDRATKRLYRLAAQMALIAGGLGTVLLLLALVAGRPLLNLIMGPPSLSALPVMLWLLAAEVVTVWGLPLEPLLFTTHKAGAAIAARSLEVAFFLPALVVMIRWYGLGGVGPATLCSVIFLVIMQLALVMRYAQQHEHVDASSSAAKTAA